jgi:uncharacterized membrane protein
VPTDRLTIAALRYVALPALGLLLAWLAWRRLDGERLERRLDARASRLVGLAVAVAGVLFVGLLVARYLTWHSHAFDLGLYDQKIWLASTRDSAWAALEQTWRGGVKVAPCGAARYWGICHFQPLYVVYAAAYRVWASPLLLLASQALLVVAGLVPCYLLARARLGSAGAGALVGALYLLYPAVQFNGLVDFRPDHIAIPCLLGAYALADRGRIAASVALAAVPALAKETLMLPLAFFGLYLAIRHRRRMVGGALFAVGLAAFVVVTFEVLAGPGRSEGAFLVGRYFSSGLASLAPALLARKIVYVLMLFGPLAFLPLVDPVGLLPALPALGIALLSSDPTHMSIQSQYTASVVAPAFAALGCAVARLQAWTRRSPSRLLGALLVLALAFSVAQGATPASINFWSASWGRQWHWRQYVPDRQAALDEAARLVPADPDVVVVTQNDVNAARLAHRHYFFPFPNALERADYVLLDTGRRPFVYWVVPRDPAPYEALVARLRASADYRLAYERDGVLLFARTAARRPGPPDLAPAPRLPEDLPR